ncbi:MAG: hypothetical protein DRN10_02100 [Thermoplasmata archaeon]|nr:MAG: hypothetical protein DRN10_02100 [Thermoplasmata archaeon]
MKVCLGGTFSILHEGHEALLKKAFEYGEVTIGITSDKLVKKLGKRVAGYEERKNNLEKFIMEKFGKKAVIVMLDDPYGPAVDGDFDAIAVSPETAGGADEINKMRRKKGLKELKVILVPFVLADDGIPVSSSRIRNEEIKGKKRVKELVIKIKSSDKEKIAEAKAAFKKFLPHMKIKFDDKTINNADYTIKFSPEGCIVEDKAGYKTTGKTAEEALIPRFNH